ncbi:PoNe immunity protein domain-containing protein [Aquimarina gracilis]|uniref:PoNe immunity protein domain-containing protein n=1 Tax=Aquimarina gracilis TaxID=874422 RepID=A0ABU5ZQH2_9FLAO|nr:PoNe immunity protein domain-containing protein [Aquimarina gracilis]MEB3344321.1 PoNe immunity protein domain-containing protein [Aquimarina gracilis]
MRDIVKDINYFEKFIIEKNDLIALNEQALLSGKVTENKVERAKFRNFGFRLETLVAKYSKGDPIVNLKESISEIIKHLPAEWGPTNTKVKEKVGKEIVYLDQYMLEPYERMLRILSLAYLLDVSDTDFETVVGIIDRDNIRDNLYEFIIKVRLPNRIQKKDAGYAPKSVVFKVYKNLHEAVVQSDLSKATKYVGQFLEKDFYHKHTGFYDAHKSKVDLYYGYWSFESAAVTKIMALNDSNFRDHQYYPKDLAK